MSATVVLFCRKALEIRRERVFCLSKNDELVAGEVLMG